MTVEALRNDEEQEREELIIRSPSPELCVRAIETLPLPIHEGEVVFTAGGSDRWPNTNSEADLSKYLSFCKKHGTFPHSGITFEFVMDGLRTKEAYVGNYGGFIQTVLQGGKFANITYEIPWEASNTAFLKFKEKILRQTLDNGYRIYDAVLKLIYDGENFFDSARLFIDQHSIKIKQDDISSDELYLTLKAWFERLVGEQNGQRELPLQG